MNSAFILGGNGQIGRAVAQTLRAAGWKVTIASRSSPAKGEAWRHVRVDRQDGKALRAALGNGVSLFVDCISYDESHARQLVSLEQATDHLVVVSSASVYCDNSGRSIDEATDLGFPDLPVPIDETHQTVEPGPSTYSTRKVAMERHLLAGIETKLTILRPCAIHGPYSKHAREWWFVRRLLDGRKVIPLAYGGNSQFQTTSVRSIAGSVQTCFDDEISGVINVTDVDAPSVREIGQTIMGVLGREATLVGLPGEAFPPKEGMSPWSVPNPIVCSSRLPSQLTYAESVRDSINWLVEFVNPRSWQDALPQLAQYPYEHFDYRAEDRLIQRLGIVTETFKTTP